MCRRHLKDLTSLMQIRPVTMHLQQMIHRMDVLGESSGNFQAYKTMIHKLQRPLKDVDNEYKFTKYMAEVQCYIFPEDVFIDPEPREIIQHQGTSL